MRSAGKTPSGIIKLAGFPFHSANFLLIIRQVILLFVFQYIQLPVESSLMALLAVSLAYAAARMLRRRLSPATITFFAVAVLVLVKNTPIGGAFNWLTNWIITVPAIAGARGILIGVALGIIATGLRILMGVDRPYNG